VEHVKMLLKENPLLVFKKENRRNGRALAEATPGKAPHDKVRREANSVGKDGAYHQ
jgi:hypothetical protein